MATHFAGKLVLSRWVFAPFGMDDFDRIFAAFKASERENRTDDGDTNSVQRL